MTSNQAIEFLIQHQPLPPDDELSQELLDGFAAVCLTLKSAPHEQAPRLLLGSLGEGDGSGSYQNLDSVLWAHPQEAVINALIEAMQIDTGSTRYFASIFAMDYPVRRLTQALIHALQAGDDSSRGMIPLTLATHARKEPKLAQDIKQAIKLRLNKRPPLELRRSLEFALEEIGVDPKGTGQRFS